MVKLVRAYYNRSQEAPYLYSTDFGSHDSEEKFVDIIFQGKGQFKNNLAAIGEEPKCWIEFSSISYEVFHTQLGKVAIIGCATPNKDTNSQKDLKA